MARLTTHILKNAQPERGKRLELRDDEEPGLIFRVTSAGSRTWSVRYRNSAGGQRRKIIGPYPSVSLSRAREEARKIKGTVAGGQDVVAADRVTKAEARRRKLRTLAGAAEAYFTDAELGLHKPNAQGPKRPRTMEEERRIYDKKIKRKFGGTSLTDLTRSEIQDFVSKESKASASNGRFCRNIIRQICSYAVWKDLIPHNPAQAIAVIPSKPRERVLNDDEVKRIWSTCERPAVLKGLQMSLDMGIAIRLALVTLQRRGEVTGMRWDEIDRKAKTWAIPAERMKGKRTQIVPLSDLAIELLDEAKHVIDGKDFVFAGRYDADQPMDADAASRGMNRLVSKLGIQSATLHDFRRTGASNLTSERIGIPRFIVSQVLAHAGDTGGAAVVTGRHYDLNDYLSEKRRALDAWALLLREIVNDVERPNNVMSIAEAR